MRLLFDLRMLVVKFIDRLLKLKDQFWEKYKISRQYELDI